MAKPFKFKMNNLSPSGDKQFKIKCRVSRFLIIAVIISIIFYVLSFTHSLVKADLPDCSNPSSFTSSYDQSYCDVQKIKDMYAPAQETNKKNLSALQSQLSSLSQKIIAMTKQLNGYQADIQKREEDIGFTQEVFNQKVRNQYIFLRLYDSITVFLFSNSASQAFQEISLRQKAADADRKTLNQYAQELSQLQKDKDTLEKSKIDLAGVQKQVNDQATYLAGEVAKVDTYLAVLSAKQESFMAAKLASLNIPLYALSGGGCSSDLTNGKNPGFSGGFGFFTFGVPNRVGLNQYGAWGRAKAGKTYDEILRAYYNFDGYQDSNATIKVNDSNGINQGNIIWTGSLDDYVKRVYEVPDSWTENGSAALKAQAIAVRSYVLAATDNGNQSICANQYCQVFKTSEKGGNWSNAVNDTAGKAMIQGGKPIKAYFSSTHGGYVYSTVDLTGWSPTSFTKRAVDTPNGSVSSIGDLQNNAYDKDSPWFYCDWGGRKDYGNTAWLKPEELADIVNVWLLAKQDSSAQKHLSQVDKPNPDGVDTWDAVTVRSKLGDSAFNSISSVSMSIDFSSGRTTTVHISGDAGSKDISGDDFKSYFNLRAPGTIQIVGPLFNVERH